MQTDAIESLILEQLPGAIVNVSSSDGRHFEATIISAQFVGKSRLAQQQLVYSVLNYYIANGDIHAISLKTHTPDEWVEKNK